MFRATPPATRSTFDFDPSFVTASGSVRGQPFSVYKSFKKRLKTYESSAHVDAERAESLAAAGFFYRGVGDDSQCGFCSATVFSWHSRHEPAVEHARHSPHCLIVRQIMRHDPSILDKLSTPPEQRAAVRKPGSPRQNPPPSSAETSLCKICFDQDMDVLFVPCNHLICCSSCSANLPHCPLCRQPATPVHVFINF